MDPPQNFLKRSRSVSHSDRWSQIPTLMPDPVYKGKAWMSTAKPLKALRVIQPLQVLQAPVWHMPPAPTLLPERDLPNEGIGADVDTADFPKPKGLVKKWENLPAIQNQKEEEKPLPQAIRFTDQAILLTKRETSHLLKWWSMTEKFEDRSGLSKRIHKEDIEPLRIFRDTFGKK